MRKITLSAATLALLITKAKLDKDPDYAELFNPEGKDNFELSDAALKKLHDNLTTVDDALAIPSVENHFKGVLYGKTDGKVKALLLTKGYTEAEVAAMVNGKSAEEKIEIAINAVETRAAAAGKAGASDREKTLETKYNELEKTLAAEKAAADQRAATIQGEFDSYRNSVAFKTYLARVQNLRKDLDPEDLEEIVISRLKREADKQGAAVHVTQAGKLELRSKADLEKPFYPADKPTTALGFDDFALSTLEAGKFIDKQPGGAGPAPGAAMPFSQAPPVDFDHASAGVMAALLGSASA
jgi:hypothetical protein